MLCACALATALSMQRTLFVSAPVPQRVSSDVFVRPALPPLESTPGYLPVRLAPGVPMEPTALAPPLYVSGPSDDSSAGSFGMYLMAGAVAAVAAHAVTQRRHSAVVLQQQQNQRRQRGPRGPQTLSDYYA